MGLWTFNGPFLFSIKWASFVFSPQTNKQKQKDKNQETEKGFSFLIFFHKQTFILTLCHSPATTMASASKNPQQNPFSLKPPRPPSSGAASTTAVASTSAEPQIRNPIPNPSSNVLPSTSNSPITMSQEDQILARSSHLTRPELLRRRSHNLKELAKCYKDHYWALMEDLKAQHREYYWRYGVSPFKDEQNQPNKRRRLGPEGETIDGDAVEGSGDNGTNNDGANGVKSDQYANSNCGSCMYGCKAKAMALTKYCQLHILKDSKQRLYTGCTNVIKRYVSSVFVLVFASVYAFYVS